MFCIDCGEKLPNQTRFCSNCGKAQNNNSSQAIQNQTQYIPTPQLPIETSPKLGGVLVKVPAWYWVWMTTHLTILLVFAPNIFYGSADGIDDFWPLDNCTNFITHQSCRFAAKYDLTEFAFYTITPLLILFLVRLMNNEKSSPRPLGGKPLYK